MSNGSGKIHSKFVTKSKKFPPLNLCPNIDRFVRLVSYEFQTIPLLLETAFSLGTITKDVCDFLKMENPCIACLSLLPKIHTNIKNPPGRPISFLGIGASANP